MQTDYHISEFVWQVAKAIGTFVYDFQTLITGAMALLAAYVAVKPVWKQLEATDLQTKILVRDTLAQRLREGRDRYGRMRKDIYDPVRKLGNLTHDYEGEVLRLSAEDAHGFESIFSGMLDWYLVTLKETEATDIEVAKTKLKSAIDDLVETLGHAHWSDHNEQHDDDEDGHHFSDEEWAEILRKGEEAKTLAASRLSAVQSALGKLEKAQKGWIDSLRLQIAGLDSAIANGQKLPLKN